MERCDFCSVMAIIRKYIGESYDISQTDLLYELFAAFANDEQNYEYVFDNGLVCRWFKGAAKISPQITRYYTDEHNKKRLSSDIEKKILPLMVDGDMAMQEIYDLIVFDTTISDGAKQRLTSGYPFPNSKEKADFLCAVLCFSMERSFIKREAGSKKLKEGKALLPLYGCNDKPYWYVTTNKMIASSEKIVETLFENDVDFDPYAEAPPVSTLEEVFFTGYIDGAQITMQEAMDFLTSGKPPRDIEEQLIVNNRMAGSYASKNLYRTIDVNYVCELAGILTDGMDNGSPDFRSTDETDYVSPNGEQFRFPPPQALPSLLNSLCTFLADGNVHPLIKSAVAQAYMTVIRPFPEGNDRLGRILSSVMQL